MIEATLKAGTKVEGKGGVWVIKEVTVHYDPFNEEWDVLGYVTREDGTEGDWSNLSNTLMKSIKAGTVKVTS